MGHVLVMWAAIVKAATYFPNWPDTTFNCLRAIPGLQTCVLYVAVQLSQ